MDDGVSSILCVTSERLQAGVTCKVADMATGEKNQDCAPIWDQCFIMEFQPHKLSISAMILCFLLPYM